MINEQAEKRMREASLPKLIAELMTGLDMMGETDEASNAWSCTCERHTTDSLSGHDKDCYYRAYFLFSAAVSEAKNRLLLQERRIRSLEAHLRVQRIVAYNTTINMNGGIGDGDAPARHMDERIALALISPLPTWSYSATPDVQLPENLSMIPEGE
jgi:hypothetical protein